MFESFLSCLWLIWAQKGPKILFLLNFREKNNFGIGCFNLIAQMSSWKAKRGSVVMQMKGKGSVKYCWSWISWHSLVGLWRSLPAARDRGRGGAEAVLAWLSSKGSRNWSETMNASGSISQMGTSAESDLQLTWTSSWSKLVHAVPLPWMRMALPAAHGYWTCWWILNFCHEQTF